jgi:hypothetical protein
MKELEPELRKDYELYLGSDLAERSVTPLRYDYEPERYRCGVHPAAHVHFGLANEIRLCSKRIMNPVSFTLFVIRRTRGNI